MFASPFFTSGRAAILPTIASDGRAAHGQLAHPDHAVGDPDGGDDAGGLERGAAGVRVGVRPERALVPVFGGGYGAGANAEAASARSAGAAAAGVARRGASTAKGWLICAPCP